MTGFPKRRKDNWTWDGTGLGTKAEARGVPEAVRTELTQTLQKAAEALDAARNEGS
jgi:hypothetical protein